MGLLIILSGIILWVYFYNRKKYHNLKHQIPASVVKNYLDSIIQNSTALKSSLFRGGGLDVDENAVPSVLPVDKMESLGQVGISLDTNSLEGDDALKAEIARLQAELQDKRNANRDLEAKITSLDSTVSEKNQRIAELEALLAEKESAAGATASDPAEVATLKKERDELREELDQYAMIGDDLADLKRLKQENAQLKSALNPDDLDDIADELEKEPDVAEAAEAPEDAPVEPEVTEEEVAAPEAEEASEVVASEESAPAEEAVAEEPVAEQEVAQAQASEANEEQEQEESTPDKSPEDLLSEFEKMLG